MATEDNAVRMPPIRPKVSSLVPPSSRAAAKPPEAPAEVEAAAGDDYDPLPLPGSSYTAAYSRPTNKPEITLHVLLKDGTCRGFAWANFDSVDMLLSEGDSGRVIILRFAGLDPAELRLSGWNLGYLYACLGRQRLVWIRERPSKRGFDGVAAPGEPADPIINISIDAWKPQRPEGSDNTLAALAALLGRMEA